MTDYVYPPLPIDTVIEPYGTLMAYGISGTEEMYWFKDRDGKISMVPASVFEPPEKLVPLKGTHVFHLAKPSKTHSEKE